MKIKLYVQADGKIPYEKWFKKLKDRNAKAKIAARLDRVLLGNLGEWNTIGEGMYEMKINYGPGYRVYFGREGNELILLLCGGDKSTQQRDINKAKEYWNDYKRRQYETN